MIPPRGPSAQRRSVLLPGALIALMAVVAVGCETAALTVGGRLAPVWNLTQALLGIPLFVLLLAYTGRMARLPWTSPAVTLALAFVGCLVAGALGGVAWGNSGDEYSYLFLADTMRHGRLWNPAPPDADLFRSAHVLLRDGRLFSPYPPAWSAFLVPFEATGTTWLANPLLTVLGGFALWRAIARICPSPAAINPLLAIGMLNPFTLFIGGSLFPHSMTFALASGIAWLQLDDEARPRLWRKITIGGLFGLLLLTRYDVFALVAVAYAIDRLLIRRLRAIPDGVAVAAGFVPFVGLALLYNMAVTGDPLQSTATWGQADEFPTEYAATVEHFILSAIARNAFWFGELVLYGASFTAVVAMVMLAGLLRRRRFRFYDAMLPLFGVFYTLQPFVAGHQYGPRYWFVALMLAPLTLASASNAPASIAAASTNGGTLRVFGQVLDLQRVGTAALLFCAITFAGLLVTNRLYSDARRVVFDATPPVQPALVLLPNRIIHLWSWQAVEQPAYVRDFTRNGADLARPILYGRLEVPEAVQRACRIDGRAVYEWLEPGTLRRMPCY